MTPDTDTRTKDLARTMFVLRLFPLLFLIAGGFMLAYGLRQYWMGRESTRWPHVQGRILSSLVKHNPGIDDEDEALIRYAYEVNDVFYTNDTITCRNVTCGLTTPSVLMEAFPSGKTVSVYYRPRNPSVSLLVPGYDNGQLLLPGIGAVFVLFGGVIIAPLYHAIAQMKRAASTRPT